MVRSLGSLLLSLGLLLLFLLAGDLVTGWLRVPIPGSVVGMVLLTAALRHRLVPLAAVRPAADLLIRNMALLFVPPGVGLMLYFDLLQASWVAIVTAGVGSTLAVLLTVGLLQQRLERSREREDGASGVL